jgi:hypothetical protein
MNIAARNTALKFSPQIRNVAQYVALYHRQLGKSSTCKESMFSTA